MKSFDAVLLIRECGSGPETDSLTEWAPLFAIFAVHATKFVVQSIKSRTVRPRNERSNANKVLQTHDGRKTQVGKLLFERRKPGPQVRQIPVPGNQGLA